jgi:hypothetical protein
MPQAMPFIAGLSFGKPERALCSLQLGPPASLQRNNQMIKRINSSFSLVDSTIQLLGMLLNSSESNSNPQ